ncbi:MAG: hypothetical protein ACE5JK_08245, partial [Candidatus Omnitrophota bacterium]
MGKLAYLFNDRIKDLAGGNITLTNEDSNFPTENSQEEQIALTTRTTNKTNILYQINMGASRQPQIFFIGNHNLNGGGIRVYSYTD